MMTEDNKKFFEKISEILLEKLNECEKIPCFTNVKVTDVFSITCGDRYNKNGIQFRLSNNPWIDLEVYDDGSWELFNHTEIDNLYYDEKTDCIRHVGTNEIEGQKGFDTMNKNRVFETVISSTNRFDSFALPKDARLKVRIAKVGAGVVILPDNGSPITAKEVVKALGLKDVEPEAEKVEKTKIILENNYDCDCNYYLSLTDSQMKLIEFLCREGLLEDWECRNMGKMEFEEI